MSGAPLKVLVGPLQGLDPRRYAIHQLRLDGLGERGYDVRGFTLRQLRAYEEFRAEPPYPVRYASSLHELLRDVEREGWVPDLVLLPYLGECALFPDIASSPVPVAAVVSDWDGWPNHLLQVTLPELDHVILDPAGLHYAAALGLADRASTSVIWTPSELRLDRLSGSEEADRPYDLTCIGASYTDRIAFALRLAARLADRRLFLGEFTTFPAYVQALQQSKVGLHLARRYEMSPRCLETMLCGAMLLVNRSNLQVPRYFDEEVHYAAYDDADEAAEKVRWFVAHPQALARVARTGRERAAALLAGPLRSRVGVWLDLLVQEVGLERLRASCAARVERRAAQGERQQVEREAYLAGAGDELAGLRRRGERLYARLVADAPDDGRVRNNHAVCLWLANRWRGRGRRVRAARLPTMRSFRVAQAGLRRALAAGDGAAPFAALNLALLEVEARRGAAAEPLLGTAAELLLSADERVDAAVRAGVLCLAQPPLHLHFRGGPQLASHPLEPLQVAAGPELVPAFRAYAAAFCLWLRGRLALERGAPAEAREHLRRGVEVAPAWFLRRLAGPERSLHRFELLSTLGDACHQTGQEQEALDAYHAHLEVVPGDWPVWVKVVKVLQALERWDELRAFCEERLSLLAAFPAKAGQLESYRRILSRLETAAHAARAGRSPSGPSPRASGERA